MGDFHDLALRRAAQLRQADERIANLRLQLEELDDLINQLRNENMELRDEIAAKDRRIDNMVADTWRPHH